MVRDFYKKAIVTFEDDKNGPVLDKRSIVVLLYIPFCLTIIYYIGHYSFLRIGLIEIGANEAVAIMDKWIRNSFSTNLGELTYWVLVLVLFYFVIPFMLIKFYFKEHLANYGLKIKGALNGYSLYITMLLIMIPLVLYFSTTSGFQEKYPFLKFNDNGALFPNLLKWEVLYCTQFFVLEFFFRGFVVFGLKSQLGKYSIFIMTIPYCMIHFGKPLPEALAAIIAGIVLGFLSFKNKSVWLGVCIHCSVGVGMDIASLWQKGMFH